ncbi:nodulation protein NfeD [Thiomicrorhabdus sp. zzn3]|uniref:NfeD family protein n=1 Tax=Thiomicrorhabdus sp. zzn3 TaxID=3039775 RepID=UPI0024374268|nr:nodulation protein NfeD [Thiomicrorhabdus sp. zzn3]MDG6777734.1 nodulation protein NfeD [Thiomicrorhabdus sp. zzn3]
MTKQKILKQRRLQTVWFVVLATLAALVVQSALAKSIQEDAFNAGDIALLRIEGIIGPATEDYVSRALQTVSSQKSQMVVIQMDTPGGLDSSMRGIIKNIVNANLPVITYVAPSGARAASAGTYILYASHIAAMAPATNLGAATPVSLPSMPNPAKAIQEKVFDSQPADPHESEAKQRFAPAAAEPSQLKAVNDAVAYIQGLAELRGRNAQWAEKAVREAASLTAQEALKLNVIDVVAENLHDLLRQLDGRIITLNDRVVMLKTQGVPVHAFTPDWRSRLLSVITNPNVAYILMLIGIYGLILEFYNPGSVLPGTIGGISLLLALYAFQLLPINYAGMGLILLGAILMIAEAFEPSFGVLGIGGVTAFVIGSVILMDTKAPGFGIDWAVIATFSVISLAVLVVIVGLALKSRSRPVVSGAEEMVGSEGEAVNEFVAKGIEGAIGFQGHVLIHGEHWQARSDVPLHKNQPVRVVEIHNLTLKVEPV